MKMINRFSDFSLLGLIIIELFKGSKKKRRSSGKTAY